MDPLTIAKEKIRAREKVIDDALAQSRNNVELFRAYASQKEENRKELLRLENSLKEANEKLWSDLQNRRSNIEEIIEKRKSLTELKNLLASLEIEDPKITLMDFAKQLQLRERDVRNAFDKEVRELKGRCKITVAALAKEVQEEEDTTKAECDKQYKAEMELISADFELDPYSKQIKEKYGAVIDALTKELEDIVVPATPEFDDPSVLSEQLVKVNCDIAKEREAMIYACDRQIEMEDFRFSACLNAPLKSDADAIDKKKAELKRELESVNQELAELQREAKKLDRVPDKNGLVKLRREAHARVVAAIQAASDDAKALIEAIHGEAERFAATVRSQRERDNETAASFRSRCETVKGKIQAMHLKNDAEELAGKKAFLERQRMMVREHLKKKCALKQEITRMKREIESSKARVEEQVRDDELKFDFVLSSFESQVVGRGIHNEGLLMELNSKINSLTRERNRLRNKVECGESRDEERLEIHRLEGVLAVRGRALSFLERELERATGNIRQTNSAKGVWDSGQSHLPRLKGDM
jgi:hypothetical protein